MQGLTQQEMIVLTCVAGNLDTPQDNVPAGFLKKDVEAQGFTKMAAILGIKSLIMKGFLDHNLYEDQDLRGEEYTGNTLTEKGWKWILDNQERFLIRKPEMG